MSSLQLVKTPFLSVVILPLRLADAPFSLGSFFRLPNISFLRLISMSLATKLFSLKLNIPLSKNNFSRIFPRLKLPWPQLKPSTSRLKPSRPRLIYFFAKFREEIIKIGEHLFAKIGFDTAKNEASKVSQNVRG